MFSTYDRRHPLAAASPLRSCQWGKPAELVLHQVDISAIYENDLRLARNELDGWHTRFAAARAALGRANRFPPASRRYGQAEAMRALNAVRKGMRAALARIAAAEVKLASAAVVRA